jgi:hypothetical protein
MRGGASELARETLELAMGTAARILPTEAARLAPPLAQAARTLLARMQQQAQSGLGAGPAAAGLYAPAPWPTWASDWKDPSSRRRTAPATGLRLPAQCHSILRQLLGLLRDGQRAEGVRQPLLGALLAYLQATRAPRLPHAPPSLLQAIYYGVCVGEMTCLLPTTAV